jgi:hypothetical protein
MATKAMDRPAGWQSLRRRLGSLAPTRWAPVRRRGVFAVLWLAFGLLPFLVPPPAAEALPDCCLGNGAHQCAMRQAAHAAGNPSIVVTVPCNAARPKAVDGTQHTALRPAPLPEGTLGLAPREPLPLAVEKVAAAVFGVRSSRAPPRFV